MVGSKQHLSVFHSVRTNIFTHKLVQSLVHFSSRFKAPKQETRGQKPRVAVVGDGSKHASLVTAVGGDTHIYKNGHLLKGKYPQLQAPGAFFIPDGVTLDRLRGFHVSMTKAGVANTVSLLKNEHT
jgi:hypothetical protein